MCGLCSVCAWYVGGVYAGGCVGCAYDMFVWCVSCFCGVCVMYVVCVLCVQVRIRVLCVCVLFVCGVCGM